MPKMRRGDIHDMAAARAAVDCAKIGLGERGPVWWNDGYPDPNRPLIRTTDYAEWFTTLETREA